MGETVADLKKRWMRDPEFRAAYNEKAPDFEIAHALIAARKRAGLTQEQLAKRMETTQPAIARMESGKHLPSSKTIRRYAEATASRVRLDLVPA